MKKSKWKYGLFLTLFLNCFSGFSQTIIASDDSYIWDTNLNGNYGDKRLITSKNDDNSSDGHIREVYLKFRNLNSLPTVTSANLRLTLESNITTTRSYSAYLVTGTWSNDFITWNNAPSFASGEIATGTHIGNLIEFDITSAVSNAIANSETFISIKIVSTQEDVTSFIYSTDTAPSDAEKPRLVINDPILSVDEELDSYSNNIAVYPNPTTNNLFIKGIENEETTIVVYNALGQLMKNEKYKSNIDLSSLKSGLYYVKIQNTLGLKTISVIKN